MSPEVNGYFEVLEKGVSVLHQLAEDLRESCTAVAEMDLAGIYQHISNQQYLAGAIRSLDEERKGWEHQLARDCGASDTQELADRFSAAIGPEGEERYRSFLHEIAAYQREVRHWNRLYAALLALSRQSVDALLNGLGCLQFTYPGLGAGPEIAPSISSRT